MAPDKHRPDVPCFMAAGKPLPDAELGARALKRNIGAMK
jgi:hypothetical protein